MLMASASFEPFFVTDDSHFNVPLSGGTKPASSPPNGVGESNTSDGHA